MERQDGGTSIYTGEIDPEAVEMARSHLSQPVLWLGEEFRGLRLSHAQAMGSGLFLVYGACEPAPGDREPSCVPPLQLQIQPSGVVPALARVNPVSVRGVDRTVGELGGLQENPDWSSLLWLPGGSTVKIYVQMEPVSEIMDAALQGLQTANHDAIGIDAVGPGESLAAVR